MNKAFLSHSSQQKPFVEAIYKSLGRHNAVYDCMTFEAGAQTVDEILAGIQSSDLFVLFLSKSAVESRWVQMEIERARLLLNRNVKRVLPLIIDDELDKTDEAIPSWLRENYNLLRLTNPQLALLKVRNTMHELLLDAYPAVKARAELFVGRGKLMDSFEREFAFRGMRKPKCLIVSGTTGVGRRTFLHHALQKQGLVKLGHEPVVLALDSKASIETAILGLASKDGGLDSSVMDMMPASLDAKIAYLQQQVIEIVQAGELLLIVDDGAIVLPNMRLSNWFVRLLDHAEFENTLSVCVVSRFRPLSTAELDVEGVMTFRVDELVDYEVMLLLQRYSTLVDKPMEDEAVRFFLPHMFGMPEQVHYTCHLVKDAGLYTAKKRVQQIIDKGKRRVEPVIAPFMADTHAMHVLALLAKLEFISFDYLYRIIGENETNLQLMAAFYASGIYSLIGVNGEYVRMNHGVADYLKRSTFEISDAHWKKVKEELGRFLADPGNTEDMDVAQLLFSVRQALLEGNDKLPSRYYIPAFTIKTVVELYNEGQHKEVITLAYASLEYRTISDDQIIRELRYWLCLALAREKDSRFDTEVKHFSGDDYHFLIGFNYRMNGKLKEAEREFRKLDDKSEAYRRAKKELSIIYLRQELYPLAKKFSKEIWESEPSNAFYTQSYAISLIKSEDRTPGDITTILSLISSIKNSRSAKAASIATILDADFQYYVNGNYGDAKEILRTAISSARGNRKYFDRALDEIERHYKKNRR